MRVRVYCVLCAFPQLNGALDVKHFSHETDAGDWEHYLMVSANVDDGFQIINVTDPYNAKCVAYGANDDGEYVELDGAYGITITYLTSYIDYKVREVLIVCCLCAQAQGQT